MEAIAQHNTLIFRALYTPAVPSFANRLLAALPRPAVKRISAHLEPVELRFGQVIYRPGGSIAHVYFPCTGVISLLTMVGTGKGAEVGMVGSEGLVGGSAALGIEVSQLLAVVQGEGTALRIASSTLRRELHSQGAWYRELFRFSQALMAQVSQTAACNRFHRVEARLSAWLLTTRDRMHSNRFHLTHTFLSLMLGARRVGVTAAATSLQKHGLIRYSRGSIEVLDPKGLEAVACDCYRIVSGIYRRTFER